MLPKEISLITDKKKNFIEKRTEAIRWLREQFPNTFQQEPRPIKIGIHEDIFNLNIEGSPAKRWIRPALTFYVNSPSYLRVLIEGTPRVDLNGEIVGIVNEREEQRAKEIIKQNKEKNLSFVKALRKQKRLEKTLKPEYSLMLDKINTTEIISQQPVRPKLTLRKAAKPIECAQS